ncbi:MAG: hypothetical protein EP343_25280 [Deltaproteobacteria bacterium]|nr:MAG: hypothetical protein EP343_25280 [Deltaproteobacteria bacterium]
MQRTLLFSLVTFGLLASPWLVGAEKTMQAFSLPNEDGKLTTIGKPWSKATVLVFFRGDW